MNMEQKENIYKNDIQKNKERKIFIYTNYALLFALIVLIGYNQININNINKGIGIKDDNPISILEKYFEKKSDESYKKFLDKKLGGDLMQDSVSLVISSGTPEIYGEEMGVSFDQAQAAINIMRKYDPYDLKPKGERIIPAGDNLKRYIEIAGKISCEYCCGAASIINPKNGQSACGCAHSMAMRGLTAYLLQNHKDMSNDEILRELARWKGIYFPKQMTKKMAEQLQNGNYTPDIASLLIGLDLPNYGDGSKGAPLPSEIENLPGMVGGC
jgi:hypothetical protein